jgi:Carbohydrate esterase, sialic acid-specific acetylesterase
MLYVILLLVGMLIGVVVQKFFGLGNILRAVGIPYPTAVAAVPPVVLPVGVPIQHHGQMLLFILAGQSNMVGWAPIPEGEPTDPRIYVFGKDYRWRIADHPIEDASNQVDMVSENLIAHFGPAMDFAFAGLERHPDIVIGLIPCAKNSSGIIQWQRDLSDQSLYGSCLKRALAASSMGKISGLLFFQGETDAANPILYPEPPPRAADWAGLFAMFITDFRADLQEPELPVVYAQIGSTGASNDFPNWEVVKEQQAAVQLPRLAMIVTDDLPLMDELHFTVDSYRILGKRFADAYWEIMEQ